MNLEIGPGRKRIPGFIAINVSATNANVQGLAEALPFSQGAFDLIYASHVIEHVPWFKSKETLKGWVDCLAPGGWLEVWTVNGLKVANQLVALENGHTWWWPDKWRRKNKEGDPYKWINGRIFAYGTDGDPNWHRALFTTRSLVMLFNEVGLVNVKVMDRSEVRGQDHGWINLGVKGQKL